MHPSPPRGMMMPSSPFRQSPKQALPLSILTLGITAMLFTGYASKFYYYASPAQHMSNQNRALADEIQRERERAREADFEARARAKEVEDAYGDRSSLEDLERAVAAYRKR